MWSDLGIIWASIGMSSCAAVAMAIAARHSFPELRPLFAAGSTLATIYAVAYVWLAFHFERAAEWTSVVRPVSLFAWLVVWIMPALASVRLWRIVSGSGRE